MGLTLDQITQIDNIQIIDNSGNLAVIKASGTAALTTDTSLVVALSPNSPLPTGSNTIGAVTQASGPWTINLTQVSGSALVLGQAVMASSLPIAIASDQSAIPVSQSGAWTTGRTWTLASGTDSVSAVQSGTWTVQQGTPPWQVVGNVASGSSDSGNPIKIGGVFNTAFPTLTNGQRGDIQLDSSARLVIAPLTNASIVKAQLQDNAGTAITLGQKTMSSSVPVAIASDQSAIPASQSGTWTVAQGAPNTLANGWPVEVTDGTNKQAVKAASTAAVATDPSAVVAFSPNSPLPTGSNTIGSVNAIQSGNWTVRLNDASGNALNSTSNALNTFITNTTLAVTQSTSPWVTNISQFGGSAVVTGTGVSGAGIPRVTVSNDSNILATQSGTWTVAQGSAAALSGAWPLKITDGTNGPVAVKAASTAAIATDPSLVVALSPNTPLPAGTNLLGSINQGTSPWVNNISQFGGSAVVTGTGVSGAGIPRVTVSNDSNILATQSGTWTVQQGTPPWQVVGNVASGSADSGGPVKVGGVFNTAFPTLTNGERGDLQLDSSARLVIAPLTNASIVKAQLQDNSGSAITLGQKTSANSLPVVIASDQSNVPANITQFGGTNISTGTGASGAGIPRVTVSNDSKVQPWDGTNTVTVKPASTASIATDTALVAALSPNTPLPTGTNTLGTVHAELQDGAGTNITSTSINSKQRLDVNLPSEGATGSAVPVDTVQIGGSDGTNLRTFSTDTSGRLRLAASTYYHPVYTARVQSATAVTTVLSTSVTATISATKAGNTIIVAATCNAGTLTITDSASQSYSTATTIAGNGTQTSKIFYFPNTAAGVTTVTISSTSSTDLNLVVVEYTGILTASPLDQTSTHGQTAATSWTSNSTSATTQATELLIGTCIGTLHNNSVFTVGGSFGSVATVLNTRGGANLELFMADQNVVATGTYAFTGTVNQSEDLYASIATFKFATPNMIAVVNSPINIKSGAGILRKVIVNTVGTGSANVLLYDNTSNVGTMIANLSLLTAIGSVDYNLNFSTGLTIVTNSTVADFTIVYD